MFARYKLVASSDQASEHGPLPPSTHRRLYPTIALVLLTVANVCVLGLSIAIWRTAGVAATVTPEVSSTPTPTSLALPNALDPQPSELARVDSLPIAFVPFHWNTPWGAPNASDADPLWDNINTAHGHIAVDHEFAAENHWPPSMDIPGMPGKGMYLLQAYHQLHCLRIVRASSLLSLFLLLLQLPPPLLGLKLGGVSVGVGTSSALLDVNLGAAKSSSVAVVAAAATKTSTITAVPTATNVNPTMPSSFSAPVQGSGILTLDNLPAMPAVIDKTLSGVLGAVYGLLSGVCSTDFKCTITVAGSIQSLLVDGDKYTASSSISAWCDKGRCYGSADIPLTATAPFTITCDQVTGTHACSATISGAANAIFTNGQQVELWGWLTPAGYCKDGVCVASISAIGDPMY
ncbi:unnamed protein product [Alternaria alternata]